MRTRLTAIVLAGGKGTRYRSATPKSLHPLLGNTPLALALDAARGAGATRLIVVCDRGDEATARAAREAGAADVVQADPDGTAGAVAAARAALAGETESDLLILPTVYPLLRPETLAELLKFHRKRRASLTILSAVVADPRGFGRVLRGDEGALRIVPESEVAGAALAVTEIGTGVGCARAGLLFGALRSGRRGGAPGERDWQAAAETLSQRGERVEAFATPGPEEIIPLATRADAARIRAALRDRTNLRLAEAGVTIIDPATAWIDLGVRIGPDSIVNPFCVLEGATTIGAWTRIGPGCHIRNAVIGDDVAVSASTVIDDAVLEDRVSIGPFARLRAGTVLRAGAHVGNFVEMKKSDFGPGAKAGHLSYLGDSEVGEGVNIGAGTITCNYDGVRKNRTVIEAGAFIGSGSELVAPVRIGRGAYVAAGSVIVEDVPAEALAIARGRQTVKDGWARRRREQNERAKTDAGK
ncbi:MAG: bifunctional UDP-N-acetylglucosamine diphosphorylase/glucosamine-1-phosphate N-acetyltransferase GlmU [Candidatus Aminicenantes bacterium]|nr:bifunctional UDP-N-acetylglucosamine diphosphorylase/glucosamine-1-phosphate N-acetyltransferase GlmU [Candidatus Aminicenantes bacterium]